MYVVKIGLSSWAFRYAGGAPGIKPARPISHVELLERAQRLGAEVVQIGDNMPLDGLDERTLRNLAAQARRLGITLEVGTAGAQSANLSRYLQIATVLDARILRVVEDMEEWHPSVEDIAANIRAVLPDCRAQGVTIALENHFAIGSRDLARVVQLVDDPYVGICLDTLNSIARLEGWREVVSLLAPYAASLHIKDGVAVKGGGVGFYIAGCPLGQGMIDIPWVLQSLRSHGRDPNALLEFWMDPAEDEATTLRQEERWIAGSLQYLRMLRDGG